MDNYQTVENCNLVGLIGILSQVCLGLIIAGTMLGMIHLTSEATLRKPKKKVASFLA